MNNDEILTPLQIELLFDYCKSQRVKYYDIQLELVDHMSVWIENEMKINGNSFRIAFTGIAAAFPAPELKMIAASKTAIIRKEAVKRFLSKLLSYFKWPKLLIPVGIYVLFFFLSIKTDAMGILVFLFSRLFYYYLFKINFKGNIILKNKKEVVKPLLVMKEMSAFLFVCSIGFTLTGLCCVKNFGVSFLAENRVMLVAFYTLFELALLSVHHVSIDMSVRIRRNFPLAFVAK